MDKRIKSFLLVLLSVGLMCACKDNDEAVQGTDCYISSFSLGNVKRTISTVNTSGNDTTYTISYSAYSFAMTVDQLAGTITNKDSLPVNSDVSAVLATVASSGTVVYKRADEGDETWRNYDTSDSIDFTSPLVFRVFSPDYTVSRDYTVTVNVHQQEGEEFSWTQVGEHAAWATADSLKMWATADGLRLLAREDGAVRLFSSDGDGKDWKEVAVDGCDGADVGSLTPFGGIWYMNTDDGGLLQSADAATWTVVPAGRAVRLLAADDARLYALSEGRVWQSADGLAWIEEPLDDSPSLLPVRDHSAVAYTQSNGVARVLWAGNRDVAAYPADAAAVVWSRSEVQGQASTGWTHFNASADNAYACPQLDGLTLLRYGDVVLALGRASLDGTTHGTLDALYVSQDNGITWKADEAYTLPAALTGRADALSATVDAENHLWVVSGGQLWRGRLNALGFDKR